MEFACSVIVFMGYGMCSWHDCGNERYGWMDGCVDDGWIAIAFKQICSDQKTQLKATAQCQIYL